MKSKDRQKRRKKHKTCDKKEAQSKLVAWNLNKSTFTLNVSKLNVPGKNQ